MVKVTRKKLVKFLNDINWKRVLNEDDGKCGEKCFVRYSNIVELCGFWIKEHKKMLEVKRQSSAVVKKKIKEKDLLWKRYTRFSSVLAFEWYRLAKKYYHM